MSKPYWPWLHTFNNVVVFTELMVHSTDQTNLSRSNASSRSQLAREMRNLHQPGMLVRATLSPRQEGSCSDSVLSLWYRLLPFFVLTHTVVKRVHPVFGANNKPTSCVFAFSVSLPHVLEMCSICALSIWYKHIMLVTSGDGNKWFAWAPQKYCGFW